MCRIWAVSYGPGGPEAEDWTPSELAQIMFPALVRGGPHAWGWMSWDGEDIAVEKFPGRCDNAQAMSLMQLDPKAKWIVGHTRYATHGSPEDMRNNHPIVHGKFIGVHNGVLRNHASILNVTGREDPKTEVDSEAIWAAINRWGHRKGLARIVGDMVTLYANRDNPRTLHVARSRGRELFYARTVGGATIMASEEQALEATGIEWATEPRAMKQNHVIRVREGKVVERFHFSPPKASFAQPTRKRQLVGASTEGRWSASGTRQAMMRAGAREIESAQEFINREKANTRIRSAMIGFHDNIADPISRVKQNKTDPDWGLVSDDGQRFFVGNNQWVSEREFISIMFDELGWE